MLTQWPTILSSSASLSSGTGPGVTSTTGRSVGTAVQEGTCCTVTLTVGWGSAAGPFAAGALLQPVSRSRTRLTIYRIDFFMETISFLTTLLNTPNASKTLQKYEEWLYFTNFPSFWARK